MLICPVCKVAISSGLPKAMNSDINFPVREDNYVKQLTVSLLFFFSIIEYSFRLASPVFIIKESHRKCV